MNRTLAPDDTHIDCDSSPLRHEISAEVIPTWLDDAFIHPHSSKVVKMGLRRPKKHGVEDHREFADQWMQSARNHLVHRLVRIKTSTRQTTEVEEFSSTFRMDRCK